MVKASIENFSLKSHFLLYELLCKCIKLYLLYDIIDDWCNDYKDM